MKLAQINDDIVLININTVHKFDIIKDDLMRALRIMEDHKVMNNMPINEYNNILRKNIETQYDKFKMLAAVNMSRKVVGYMAAFIVIDDNQQNGCLIYGAYFHSMLMKIILPYMLYYLDQFASQHNCEDMLFSTSRNAKAYERLLKDFYFKPTHTTFRRSIPSVSYIRKAI